MPSFQTCVLCLQVSAGDALYRFQEVIYGSGEAVQPEEYVGIGQVTEFRFGVDLYNNFHQGVQNTMQYLVDFGGDSWSLLPSDSAVTFTDNHDTALGDERGPTRTASTQPRNTSCSPTPRPP